MSASALLLALTALGGLATRTVAAPLDVDATLPDLGAIVREVGGDEVRVTVFAKGTESPHFVVAKPTFVTSLTEADLLVLAGLEVEAGWLPALLQGCGNAKVLPGGPGHLDASTAITPIDVPSGGIHPHGDPHYLTDPLNGLAVAALVRDRLGALRPARSADFAARYDAFRQQLGARLVGERLAGRYDIEKLAALYGDGTLDDFLRRQGDEALLGGWLATMRPFRGTKAVDDHATWAYFARRFGLQIVGHIEPQPGMPPTARHLAELVTMMHATHVRLILASAYYDPRYARALAEQTQARMVPLANLVGARPGTEDYLSMIDHDVRQLATVMGGPP